ncbi:MAG: hypothetical protein D6707_04720 [Bacteroidetes bacterium]|nr:MAG: hypothetical protein D6707_04720 [Bacteroidota bacterium]
MLGFVLIVILVMVIFVVFILISLGKSKTKVEETPEISYFLSSIQEFTTSCARNYQTDFYNLKGLMIACKNGEECLDGRESCKVLKDTMKDMLSTSWSAGNSSVKGYLLEIHYEDPSKNLQFKEGDKTENFQTGRSSFVRGEKVNLTLSVYY